MRLFQSSAPIATVPRVRSLPVGTALAAVLATLLCALHGAPAHAQGRTTSAKPVVTDRSADPGMEAAQKASIQKNYEQAISGFDRVIATNPRNVQARFERAWALSQLGREDEAITAFAQIAQDFPELPEPHNNLALIYAKRGDLKRAEAELLLALDARPDFAIGYTNLGDIYRRLAENAYAAALKRNPRDAKAKAGLAQVQLPPASNASGTPKAPAASGRGAAALPAGTTTTDADDAKPAIDATPITERPYGVPQTPRPGVDD